MVQTMLDAFYFTVLYTNIARHSQAENEYNRSMTNATPTLPTTIAFEYILSRVKTINTQPAVIIEIAL